MVEKHRKMCKIQSCEVCEVCILLYYARKSVTTFQNVVTLFRAKYKLKYTKFANFTWLYFTHFTKVIWKLKSMRSRTVCDYRPAKFQKGQLTLRCVPFQSSRVEISNDVSFQNFGKSSGEIYPINFPTTNHEIDYLRFKMIPRQPIPCCFNQFVFTRCDLYYRLLYCRDKCRRDKCRLVDYRSGKSHLARSRNSSCPFKKFILPLVKTLYK